MTHSSGNGKTDLSAARDDYSRRMWSMASMGATLTSEILAGTGIGWLLDKVFDTAPWCLVGGTIAGLTVGMTTFLRSALSESRQAGRDARRMAASIEPDGSTTEQIDDHDDDDHDNHEDDRPRSGW
ncbi:MAG: AtpZ/AtpI family protein [Planctomycetota bacterium]